MNLSPADWLALREPADASARSTELTRAIGERLPGDRPVRILDLATGTASNLRYLSMRLPNPQQHWLITDRNPSLLSEVPSRSSGWTATNGLTLVTRMKTLVVTGEGQAVGRSPARASR